MMTYRFSAFCFTVICVLTPFLNFSNANIKFENGYYNGIVIGIDGEKISASECENLLKHLQSIITEFSSKLYSATSERARIGRVDILLPLNWTFFNCQFPNSSYISPAPTSYSYQDSALQVTKDHPLAQSLPWTRQYKPCGQSGDSIILPFSFIQSSSGLTDSVKGQLLLHEWTKFRYGAFDEIGYDGGDDELFSPCYMQNGRAQMTCCSKPQLQSVAGNESECTLEFLINQKDRLIQQLTQSTSSVMSSPYIENVSDFCNETSHNPWALTKQNVYCDRKSVSEVVNSHKDFQTLRSSNEKHTRQFSNPEFQIVQHERRYSGAYAFVIEDSADMRSQFKIVHVKQAIAQFLDMLENGTEVRVEIFSGNTVVFSRGASLSNDVVKQQVLGYVPEPNGTPIFNDASIHNLTSNMPLQLDQVLDDVNRTLSMRADNTWNVILITSSSFVENMDECLRKFQETPYTMSILTFNTSSEWLQWYGIPNTKNVISLPYCNQLSQPCSLQTSAFMVDQFVALMNNQQFNPRIIQKVAQVTVPNIVGSERFHIIGDPNKVNRMFLFVTVPQRVDDSAASSMVTMYHASSGARCTAKRLLGYGYVIKFTEEDSVGSPCHFQNGEWSVSLNNSIPGARMLLHVFLDYNTSTMDKLIVTPTLGLLDMTQGIYPTNNITSAFVKITTDKGEPVLDAQVTVQLFNTTSLSSGLGPSKSIELLDNGDTSNGADQTENDGVYSAYLSGYSKTQGFHFLQIDVSTENSRILETIQSPKAVLLDNIMREKCCGKVIHPQTTRPLDEMKFKILHYGFRTMEDFVELWLPPGQIDSIKRFEESSTSMSVEFTSVVADLSDDSVRIKSIQACCVPRNFSESSLVPDASDCKSGSTNCGTFVPPGVLQKCTMNKETLVSLFSAGQTGTQLLACGLRVENTNSQFGKISSIFEVDVSAITNGGNNGELECKSLSDDCLPIWLFWVLVGCLALIFLVLIMLACCWWCSSRKKSKAVPSTKAKKYPNQNNELSVYYNNRRDNHVRPPSPKQKTPETEPKVVKELFVNHAYIQDGDGEIKIIADNGQILRKPKTSTENIDATIGQIANNRVPANAVALPIGNMQVFKPHPPPKPKPSAPPLRSNSKTKRHQPQQRPEIIHSNPMLQSDIPHEQYNGDFDYRRTDMATPSPHATSPTRTDPSLVYATISRTGRLKHNGTTFVAAPSSSKTATLPSRRVAIDPHYMVPHGTSRSREPLPNMELPQVQRYPSSSESDTSEARGGEFIRSQNQYPGRRRPSKPPPYPAGSKLVSAAGMFNGPPVVQPRTNLQSPNTPPAFPPVPPPRYDGGQRSAVQNFTSAQDMQNFDGDDDSDEWDDGDFDFNTGVSYA